MLVCPIPVFRFSGTPPVKTLQDLLTLALLLNAIKRLPQMVLRGMSLGLLLLVTLITVVEYEVRTARQTRLERMQYQDESKPAQVYLGGRLKP